jgi:hypothetical protein
MSSCSEGWRKKKININKYKEFQFGKHNSKPTFTEVLTVLMLESHSYVRRHQPVLTFRVKWQTCLCHGGVGVRLAADSWSTSPSRYRAPFWGPWPDFILILSLVTIALLFFLGRPLWREDGPVTYSAIADWSGHWGPITIHYRLVWDCVPSSSPLMTRRDYGGGILIHLHTGL